MKLGSVGVLQCILIVDSMMDLRDGNDSMMVDVPSVPIPLIFATHVCLTQKILCIHKLDLF